ncbi:MAG: DNA repair protein RecN [Firmicutes bacterium]|nr:DNA repair protein RecN [Bacillota bacterium]
MLTGLSIENFAVIKKLDISLEGGLSVITGETGAGKSVVIEALSMALGSRADTDYIRTGEDKAVVTLVVDGSEEELIPKLKDLGVPEELPVIIRREISSQSRSLCRINGSIVSLSQLSAFSRGAADVHGQYDHQYLLDKDRHLGVLDLYGGAEVKSAREVTAERFASYAALSAELMDLRKRLSEGKRQRELLSFELHDIDAARVRPKEDEELEEQIAVMEHSEQIFEALSSAYEQVFGADDSAVSRLGSAVESLEGVESFSSEIRGFSEELKDLYYRADDMRTGLRRLRDGSEFSADDLDSSIERLELLKSLKRKYGGSLDAVIEYAENARKTLESLENSDEKVRELEKAIQEARKLYDEAASKLGGLRKEAAEKLSSKVETELSELNFKNARFSVKLDKGPISENGTDTAEFLISANLGEDLKPLAKVASGGELSRIMLALKRIIADLDGIPTLIFDEIDTGISGSTAGVVGRKLRSIAAGHQVICITHLPQIASMGDHHYMIKKETDGSGTMTTVAPLSDEERIEELARLLSGTEITESARAQARELIASALR